MDGAQALQYFPKPFCKLLTLEAILSQNVTVFLLKTLPSFFQMQEKLETCRNSDLTYFRKPSFSDGINVTFILYQPVPWILNNFI